MVQVGSRDIAIACIRAIRIVRGCGGVGIGVGSNGTSSGEDAGCVRIGLLSFETAKLGAALGDLIVHQRWGQRC